ncbi:MAG: glutathione S-transferase N-terminal domain-containing protein [Hyphomicrobiales bacterium]
MSLILYDLCGADHARRFSPYCWRIKRALQYKGLVYETVPVPFKDISRIEGNTNKTLPLLRIGEMVVSDSFTIAEYLDDQFPDTPLLFKGDDARALSRFVEAWTYSALHPGIVRMVVKDIHDILDEENQVYFRQTRELALKTTLEMAHAEREQHKQVFHKNLLTLDLMLRKQPYIGGQRPSFADFIVYGSLKWPAECSDYDVLPDKDRIQRWYQNLDG